MKRFFGNFLIALVIVIFFSGILYEIKFIITPDVTDIGIADDHHREVENYVVICEENGLHTFPFVFGGSMSLLSIPDGKKYGIVDDKSFLKGFGNPIICDGCVYYTETWDSSEQGGLYKYELDTGNVEYLQSIYDTPFYIMKNYIYYLDEESHQLKALDMHTSDSKTLIVDSISTFCLTDSALYYYVQDRGELYKCNLEDVEKKALIWEVGSYEILDILIDQSSNVFLQTAENGIIMCEDFSNKVKMVVNNGDLKESTCYYKSALLHLKKNSLYYLDEKWNVYFVNVKTEEIQKVLASSDINFLNLAEEIFRDSDVVISWCDDYIVFQISSYTEDKEWKCGIIAFDYEGNEVYRNDKMKLNL